MEIRLTPVEHALARQIARLRYEFNRKHNNKNHLRKPQEYEKSELDGFGAELAVAKALNVYPDLETETAQGEDLLFHGYSIDVKQTHRERGRLLLTMEKTKLCDYYCLVIGEMPNYRIAGFASLDSIRQTLNIVNLGYGDTYVMDQDRLMTLESFCHKTMG